MPQFLVAIHRPDDYDPATAEDAAMARDISALNADMQSAGVRAFAGGLQPIGRAVAVRRQTGGGVLMTDGPYMETKEHVGGFWILEVADLDAALGWAGKAAIACRANVEVRRFH